MNYKTKLEIVKRYLLFIDTERSMVENEFNNEGLFISFVNSICDKYEITVDEFHEIIKEFSSYLNMRLF